MCPNVITDLLHFTERWQGASNRVFKWKEAALLLQTMKSSPGEGRWASLSQACPSRPLKPRGSLRHRAHRTCAHSLCPLSPQNTTQNLRGKPLSQHRHACPPRGLHSPVKAQHPPGGKQSRHLLNARLSGEPCACVHSLRHSVQAPTVTGRATPDSDRTSVSVSLTWG